MPGNPGVRPGRCRNDIYCSLANANRILRMLPDEPFLCPECLKPLRDLPAPAQPRGPAGKVWLIATAGLCAAVLCLLVARAVLVGRHRAPASVPTPAAPKPAQTLVTALPAQNLALRRTTAYDELGPAPPPLTVPARPIRQAKPVASPRASRGFSGEPVAGGEPPFPDARQSQGVIGLVRVRCRIETDGTPTACEASAAAGGQSFSKSVLSWLKSGKVRFAPILRHGQPVAEFQSWTIESSADPPDEE